MRLATTWQNLLFPSPGKNLSGAHAPLCVDQGFSNFFAHVPLSSKRIISQHLIYAAVLKQVYKQDNFLVFS